MCGIVGFCGSFGEAALDSALAAIGHRGPDGHDTFIDQARAIGLGHARLAILDLSPAGHQPMTSSDGNATIVYNGEIYNFLELRTELEAKGHVFRSNSDTEVLLTLYMEEGGAMLGRLNGIFAFALLDRQRDVLFMARDGYGVKPLYFARDDRGVAFSSEIKGLLRLMPALTELNVRAIHQYLSFLWTPGANTPLAQVKKLLPGEALEVSGGAIIRQWTWFKSPALSHPASVLSEDAAIAGTTEKLRQAVHRQMVSDVPVGAFLSGGLDSSAIVAFAGEITPDLRCFTIDSGSTQDAGVSNDLPYAKRVAEHLGVKLDIVQIDPERMAADLASMVIQLDEPVADPAPLNVRYISRLARDNGIKVLLSGAGGDDLFTGYRRHRALDLERYWNWAPLQLREVAERAAKSLDQRRSVFRRLAKLTRGAGLEGDARLANYFVWSDQAELQKLYTADFRERLDGYLATQPMLDYLEGMPRDVAPIDRMLALEQRFFLPDHNLMYTDKMSMAEGVEVRVPFLDNDLVEFARRIPHRFKQRGAVGKWVFKRAMEPFLPADVIYRPKTGFGAPLRRWMRHDLRGLVAEMLSEARLRRRNLFNPTAVAQLISANDAGRIDGGYTIFSLLCIEIWCSHYLDSRPVQAPLPSRGLLASIS